MSVAGIVFEDVPQNWPAANFHHRLRLRLRFFREACAQAAGQCRDLQVVWRAHRKVSVWGSFLGSRECSRRKWEASEREAAIHQPKCQATDYSFLVIAVLLTLAIPDALARRRKRAPVQ